VALQMIGYSDKVITTDMNILNNCCFTYPRIRYCDRATANWGYNSFEESMKNAGVGSCAGCMLSKQCIFTTFLPGRLKMQAKSSYR